MALIGYAWIINIQSIRKSATWLPSALCGLRPRERIRPKHRLKGEPSLRRADCRNPRIRRGAPALAQGTSFGISRHIGARETPGRCEYFLTDKGQALGPVLKAQALWMKSSSGRALGRFQKRK